MNRPRIELPCLCMVTDESTVSASLLKTVSAAVDGGVGMVQLRRKDLPARSLLSLARDLRAITSGRALLIVNDRVDVALLSGADGVQLGEDSLDVPSARKLIGAHMLIGRSVHSLEGALEAESRGADYLALGTMFPTSSHPGAQTGGVELAREVAGRVRIPTLCIGGVTASNVGELIAAGAAGAAVISAISMSPDPSDGAARLVESMRRAYSKAAG